MTIQTIMLIFVGFGVYGILSAVEDIVRFIIFVARSAQEVRFYKKKIKSLDEVIKTYKDTMDC